MKALPLALALLVAMTSTVLAQSTFDLRPDSRVWIEGSATAKKFTCRVNTLRAPSNARSLEIPVETIECENGRMTRDMQETLNADSHPVLRFDLIDALATPDSVTALGSMTISGVTQPVSVAGRLTRTQNGDYRLVGSERLLLTDFGITPPTKFLGLIKVHNAIDVRFDLVAARRDSVASNDAR